MASEWVKVLGISVIAAGIGFTVVAQPASAAEVGVTIDLAPGAPPPPRYEAVPPPPPARAERVVWMKGRWRWDGHNYIWVPGHYMERPRRGARWMEGHWDHRPGGYVWVEGHWG